MAWKRRGGFRQKPWNKPSRIEKFWAVPAQAADGITYELAAGNNNAAWIVNVSGYELAAHGLVASASGTNSALGHCKVHRIQGHIWAWLNPIDQETQKGAIATAVTIGGGAKAKDAGIYPLPNIAMCTYFWLKLKTDANTPTEGGSLGVPADLNPAPSQDQQQMLVRDDIISWGSVPVYGIIPRIWDQWLFGATTSVNLTMQHGPQAQYLQSHVAKIPTPRIPKLGLNLRRGERLVCAVAQWPGPGGDSNGVDDDVNVRSMLLYPQLRYFCSL